MSCDIFQTRKWGERNAPCKGCADRVVGCHGKCDRYAAFKAQNDKERDQRREFLQQNDVLSDLHRKRCKAR